MFFKPFSYAGFNLSGGLRGIGYVLDRRRTNSIRKQKSCEESEPSEEDLVQDDNKDMGVTQSQEAPSTEKKIQAESPPPPEEPMEPSLEEIYAQTQPAANSRLYSCTDSRDSMMSSSLDSVASEFASGLDRIGHQNSVDHPLFRADSVCLDDRLRRLSGVNKSSTEVSIKDAVSSGRDASNISSRGTSDDISRTDSSNISNKDVSSSNVSKEVFHSDDAKPKSSSLVVDSIDERDVVTKEDSLEEEDSLESGALSEERIKEIREELMLRALVVRARMVIPSPQLPPVDEETESSEPRTTPYRIGSLDVSVPVTNSDRDHHGDNKNNKSVVTKAHSTSELEMNSTPRKTLSSPPSSTTTTPSKVDKKKKIETPDDGGNQEEGDDVSTADIPKEDSNKLKPVSATHRAATERLIKDNAHGGQESFEIEEVSLLYRACQKNCPMKKSNY